MVARGEVTCANPCHALECSAIHRTASRSVKKLLMTSALPSGHTISTPQPVPGFLRAVKVGRRTNIYRICAADCAVSSQELCQPFKNDRRSRVDATVKVWGRKRRGRGLRIGNLARGEFYMHFSGPPRRSNVGYGAE